MRLLIEKYSHWGIALLITIVYAFFLGFSAPGNLRDLFSTVINVSGIAIGFLATMRFFLLSMKNDNYLLKQLANAGLNDVVNRYFSGAIHWAFFLILLSGAGFFVQWDIAAPWHGPVFLLWIFVLAGTTAACFRIIHIVAKIID